MYVEVGKFDIMTGPIRVRGSVQVLFDKFNIGPVWLRIIADTLDADRFWKFWEGHCRLFVSHGLRSNEGYLFDSGMVDMDYITTAIDDLLRIKGFIICSDYLNIINNERTLEAL